MKLVKSAKIGYVFASVAVILIGCVFLIRPEISLVTLSCAFGTVILILGAAKLFGYFANDLYRLAFQYDLALGILTMLLGVFMIAMPEKFSKILMIAAAIYVIVNALFTLQTAVEAKRFGITKWWLVLLGAIFSGAVGILLLLNPFESAVALTRLAGIAFIADGVQNLLVAMLTIHTGSGEDF